MFDVTLKADAYRQPAKLGIQPITLLVQRKNLALRLMQNLKET
jgi:hypothetical protein